VEKNGEKLSVTLKGMRTATTEEYDVTTGKIVKKSQEIIDIIPITISYRIDDDYINEYLNELYHCNYKIKGVLALVPDKSESCKEEWCMIPLFKVKGNNSIDVFEYLDKFKCNN